MFTPLAWKRPSRVVPVFRLPDLHQSSQTVAVILFVFVFNFRRGRTPSPPPPSTNSILISVTGDHIKSKGNGITPSREKLFDLRFEGHFFRLLLPPFAGRARTVATQDSSDFMSRIVWSRLSSSEHIRGDFLMGFKVQQQSRATYPLHNSHGIVLIKFEDAKRMSLLRGRLLSRLIADPLK